MMFDIRKRMPKTSNKNAAHPAPTGGTAGRDIKTYHSLKISPLL